MNYIKTNPNASLTDGMHLLVDALKVNGFPMIQISGSSNRNIIDLQQGDYEGLDQMNIAKPFVKAAYRINRPQDIAIGAISNVSELLAKSPEVK